MRLELTAEHLLTAIASLLNGGFSHSVVAESHPVYALKIQVCLRLMFQSEELSCRAKRLS
jgi:hypothetical protein